MAIRLEDFLNDLPEDRRAAVEARTEELAYAVTLRQMREAYKQSQKSVADKLQVEQGAVSKLERRTDVRVSTLRDYVEAMGGTLEIRALFPDREMKIGQFSRGVKKARKPSPKPHRKAGA